MGSLSFEELELTPAIATLWLEDHNYADNRRIDKGRAALYARQITAGRWRLNGQPIIFDGDGMMLNGQHRCAAVIVAGKSIVVAVTHGVESSTFTTMDQSKTRSSSAVLFMEGHTYVSERAAVARALYCWETSDGKSPLGSKRILPDEVLLTQEVYPDEVNAAVEFVVGCKRDVPVSSGILGLAHILFKRARPRKSVEFLSVLATGLTTTAKHPALTFRRRVIRDKMRDRSLPYPALWSMMIRAWNAYERGDSLSVLGARRSDDGHWVTPSIRGLTKAKTGLK